MSQIKYGEPGEFSKDFKFIQTIGGKRMIHARGCPYITDWDTEGCREVFVLEKTKGGYRYPICPTCEKLVYIANGASDYSENWRKYQRLFEDASCCLIQKLFADRDGTCYWYGDRLYITCGEDTWYLDTSLDIRLFHNNYDAAERRKTGETSIGFHEHEFKDASVSSRINNFLRQITNYKFEEADKIHQKKAAKRKKHTFSEYDPEFYGFVNTR